MVLRAVTLVAVQVLVSVRVQIVVRAELEAAAVLVLLPGVHLVWAAVPQFRRVLLRVERWLLRAVKFFSWQ